MGLTTALSAGGRRHGLLPVLCSHYRAGSDPVDHRGNAPGLAGFVVDLSRLCIEAPQFMRSDARA